MSEPTYADPMKTRTRDADTSAKPAKQQTARGDKGGPEGQGMVRRALEAAALELDLVPKDAPAAAVLGAAERVIAYLDHALAFAAPRSKRAVAVAADRLDLAFTAFDLRVLKPNTDGVASQSVFPALKGKLRDLRSTLGLGSNKHGNGGRPRSGDPKALARESLPSVLKAALDASSRLETSLDQSTEANRDSIVETGTPAVHGLVSHALLLVERVAETKRAPFGDEVVAIATRVGRINRWIKTRTNNGSMRQVFDPVRSTTDEVLRLVGKPVIGEMGELLITDKAREQSDNEKGTQGVNLGVLAAALDNRAKAQRDGADRFLAEAGEVDPVESSVLKELLAATATAVLGHAAGRLGGALLELTGLVGKELLDLAADVLVDTTQGAAAESVNAVIKGENVPKRASDLQVRRYFAEGLKRGIDRARLEEEKRLRETTNEGQMSNAELERLGDLFKSPTVTSMAVETTFEQACLGWASYLARAKLGASAAGTDLTSMDGYFPLEAGSVPGVAVIDVEIDLASLAVVTRLEVAGVNSLLTAGVIRSCAGSVAQLALPKEMTIGIARGSAYTRAAFAVDERNSLRDHNNWEMLRDDLATTSLAAFTTPEALLAYLVPRMLVAVPAAPVRVTPPSNNSQRAS